MVLEHIDDPFLFVSRMHELTKNGRFIYIEVPSFKTLFLPGESNFYGDYTHVRPYSKKSLRRLLNDTGFDVVKMYAGESFHIRFFGMPLAFFKGLFLLKRYHFHRALIRLINADPLKVFGKKN